MILRKNPLVLTAAAALLLGCILFEKQAQMGLSLLEFNDEAEQFIVGKLLTHGRHLYRDIFSHHGPFPYIIAHGYATFVSYSDFSKIRFFQIILASISCLAIMFSSALKTRVGQLWAGAIYLLILTPIWNLEVLNALTYYAISSFLVVILIAQFVFPLILGEEPERVGTVVSGFAAGLVICCAYSNGPGVVLLSLATIPGLLKIAKDRRLGNVVGWFSVGVFVSVGSVALWTLRFGDLKGFFIYHLYFNQHVYSKLVNFSITSFLDNITISFEPRSIVHSLAVFLMFYWVYVALMNFARANDVRNSSLELMSILFLLLGVLFTNPRGSNSLIDAGFVVSNVALFALSAARSLELSLNMRMRMPVLQVISIPLLAIILAYRVCSYAVNFWGIPESEFPKYLRALKPSSEPIYEFVRSITSEYGDLLVLNLGAEIYLKADRLPASGNLFYFPQQAIYNRSPVGGYSLDVCADISRLPKAIWLLNRRFEPLQSIDEYEPCTLPLITKNYTELGFGSPWYVRNDILNRVKARVPKKTQSELDLEPNTEGDILRASAELSPFTSIKLLIDPHNAERGLPLKRIGILFSKQDERVAGTAELLLKTAYGSFMSRRFPLSAVTDNAYTFIDVDPNLYVSGDIRAIEGGGIRTWESHFIQGMEPWLAKSYTCIIYVYGDDTRRYSPVCPVM